MSFYRTLLGVVACLSVIAFVTPIKEGENVGRVRKVSRKVTVYGQELYPFIVHITTTETKGIVSRSQICTGVIVTKDTILTAAHCLHSKVNLEVVVHAGIVDVAWEKNKGQEVLMKDYLIHEQYHSECLVGTRCSFEINDLAILWLKEELVLGTNVRKAIFNRHIIKPINKEGWILGWGLNSEDDEPSMLQRGLMKVIPTRQCEKFNPNVYITQNSICLSGVKKGTTSALGDSGGPFVIDSVVYGISSVGIYKMPSFTEVIDLYTDTSIYLRWMLINVKAGPPNGRKNRATSKIKTHQDYLGTDRHVLTN